MSTRPTAQSLCALLLLLQLGVGTALAGPALGTAEFAAPPPGTKITYKDHNDLRYTRIIEKADDYRVEQLTEEGDPTAEIPFCHGCARATIPLERYARIWPLKVGRKARFYRSRGNDTWRERIKVTGTEVVRLEFGAVDTFVVETRSSKLKSSWESEGKYWYAPRIGVTVKSRWSDSTGYTLTTEATAVTPPR